MSTSSAAVLPAPAAAGRALEAKVAFRDTPEAEIVRRAQQGDEAAFRQIVEGYQDLVFSTAYGIVRQKEDAEDIAQQVFMNAYLNLKRFDLRSALSTWLCAIARNASFDYKRKKKVRKLDYESDLSKDDELKYRNRTEGVDRSASASATMERRDLLMKLFKKLSAEESALLLQKEVEGLSIQDLALRTGLKENTIKVKLHRARQKLVKVAGKLQRKP